MPNVNSLDARASMAPGGLATGLTDVLNAIVNGYAGTQDRREERQFEMAKWQQAKNRQDRQDALEEQVRRTQLEATLLEMENTRRESERKQSVLWPRDDQQDARTLTEQERADQERELKLAPLGATPAERLEKVRREAFLAEQQPYLEAGLPAPGWKVPQNDEDAARNEAMDQRRALAQQQVQAKRMEAAQKQAAMLAQKAATDVDGTFDEDAFLRHYQAILGAMSSRGADPSPAESPIDRARIERERAAQERAIRDQRERRASVSSDAAAAIGATGAPMPMAPSSAERAAVAPGFAPPPPAPSGRQITPDALVRSVAQPKNAPDLGYRRSLGEQAGIARQLEAMKPGYGQTYMARQQAWHDQWLDAMNRGDQVTADRLQALIVKTSTEHGF